MQNPIYILGIESSCDDTGAAIIKDGKIISNLVANQIIHQKYGGVVPELASRAHQQNIIPVVKESLNLAKIGLKDLSAIAVTKGPGLLGALMVGTSFSKALSFALNIPIIEVNHLQGHILSHFIEPPLPQFPFLCLLVSGGHTLIVRVNNFFEMEILGQTTDDAAGEAFDKSGKILGLTYPGGVLIDKYALSGNPFAFSFPEPNVPNLDYSFSGLKTSFLYFVEKKIKSNNNFIAENLPDLAASIQFSIVKYLLKNLLKASKITGIKEIAIAGGVSANSGLRASFLEMAGKEKWKTYIPSFEYCTDNAAMIAMAGHYKFLNNDFSDQELMPEARMRF
jgi:N6-L-threonylcarbamoyladenine synthase